MTTESKSGSFREFLSRIKSEGVHIEVDQELDIKYDIVA